MHVNHKSCAATAVIFATLTGMHNSGVLLPAGCAMVSKGEASCGPAAPAGAWRGGHRGAAHVAGVAHLRHLPRE